MNDFVIDTNQLLAVILTDIKILGEDLRRRLIANKHEREFIPEEDMRRASSFVRHIADALYPMDLPQEYSFIIDNYYARKRSFIKTATWHYLWNGIIELRPEYKQKPVLRVFHAGDNQRH